MKRVTKKNVMDAIGLAQALVERQNNALEDVGGWDDGSEIASFWDEIAEEHPILGWGSTRVAIAVPGGKLVIKLPRDHYGLNDNGAEGERWFRAPPRVQRCLAQVYAYSDDFVVMRRCEQVSSTRMYRLNYIEVLLTIESFFVDVEDIDSLRNWGVLGHRPVLLDYGWTY